MYIIHHYFDAIIQVSVSWKLTSAPHPLFLWQYSEVDGLLAQMASHNVSPNVVTYNILIDHYARAGFWSRAFGALDQMRASKVSTGTQTHSTGTQTQYGGTQTHHRERGTHTHSRGTQTHVHAFWDPASMVKPHDRSYHSLPRLFCAVV
jgi:pentatricopeptide repeat protein